MGNRSYLYLTHPNDPEANDEFAEANNNVPVLWHIFLAQGEAAAPIADQRVFSDAGTDNIAADLSAARARLRRFAGFVATHPLIDRVPALPRYLRAIDAYLDTLAAHYDAPEALRLSANLDEYSWLGEDDPEQFVIEQRREFDTTWAKLEHAMAGNDHPALEAALGFDWSDWEAWCWEFGIGGFTFYHDYFRTCDDEPREVEFADYVPEDDPSEEEGDNDLGLNRRRFARDGLYGVLHIGADGQPAGVVVEPEWQSIGPCDEDEREELWVRKNNRYGLMRVSPDGEARLLLEPCLDEVWGFATGCAVVRTNGKMGMLRLDGTWRIKPNFDELWDYCNGYAHARLGGLDGFLDEAGAWAITPRFDDAWDFSEQGLARVQLGGKCGLIRTDGSFAIALEYDDIDWDDACQAWRLKRDERIGLAWPDGSPGIALEWDGIAAVDDRASAYVVRRGDHCGLCEPDGRLRLPCIYRSIDLRGAGEDDSPQSLAEMQFVVRTDAGMGVVDIDNTVLVPCIHTKVDELHPYAPHGTRFPTATLVRVSAKKKGASYGVWDIGAGRLLVPCAYKRIEPLCLDQDSRPLFVVSPPANGRDKDVLRLGVLAGDGSQLHAPDYAWFGTPGRLGREFDLQMSRHALFEAWSKDEPVVAGRSDGRYVWLHPDGRSQDYADKLTADYAAGDLKAAHTLGKAYRDGEGVAADAGLARRWLERAAGDGLPAAIADLAWLLESEGNEPVRVRNLLERALEQPQGWSTADSRNLLGCHYLNGTGGEARYEDAFQLFQLAASQGSASAIFNSALCLANGWGTEQNETLALARYREAEKKGVRNAAYQVGRLLENNAKRMNPEQALQTRKEAAHFFRRELEDENRSNPDCCHALARQIEHGVRPQYADEMREVLERGARADDIDCIDWLLELLEGADSRWRNAERAAAWRARRRELGGS